MNTTLELYRHMEWADAELWRVLRATAGAFEDAKLMKLVRHIHGVQHAFLRMWTGASLEEGLFGRRDPDALQQFGREFYASGPAFVAQYDPARLEDVLEMPWLPEFEKQLGRGLQRPTFEETFLQLPMHSQYHRGQANLRLREVGGEPPLVDFIAWVWFGRPDPQWPSGAPDS